MDGRRLDDRLLEDVLRCLHAFVFVRIEHL
jgi:hypothetical protein